MRLKIGKICPRSATMLATITYVRQAPSLSGLILVVIIVLLEEIVGEVPGLAV